MKLQTNEIPAFSLLKWAIIPVLCKGMLFQAPLYYYPVYVTGILMLCDFILSEGSAMLTSFRTLVGATLLTSIVANVAVLCYLQRCDQKVPPHPHQKSLNGKC